MSREAFGPGLRRARLQRGLSLEVLAEATRVPTDLWRGLEENDLSRWPSGIFARAYVRQYAVAVGLDADTTVDEFCRWFPEGDRRAERVIREHAVMVGHSLDWNDDLVGITLDNNRRADDPNRPRVAALFRPERARIVAAIGDAGAVVAAGLTAAALLPIGRSTAIGLCALVYHLTALSLLGCTPAVWAIDTYLRSQHPASSGSRGPRFKFVRSSPGVKTS